MVSLGRVAAAGEISRPYSQNTSKPAPRRVETERERERERETAGGLGGWRGAERWWWPETYLYVRVFAHFPVLSLIVKKWACFAQIYFYTFILMHMPLKWELANPDLNNTQSPTLNGMKSAPPRTYAPNSLAENCCCNVARVLLLPLLGQPGRVRRHDLPLATSRWDTWQVRALKNQLETRTR